MDRVEKLLSPIMSWVQPDSRPRVWGGEISAWYLSFVSINLSVVQKRVAHIGTIIDKTPMDQPATNRPAMSMPTLTAAV